MKQTVKNNGKERKMDYQEIIKKALAENKDFSIKSVTHPDGVVFDVLYYKGSFINLCKQGDWIEANKILDTASRILRA